MKDQRIDTELEKELQELYMLARHWSADIAFLEEELQFFKNILDKYISAPSGPADPQNTAFVQKVFELEDNLASLRAQIPGFLSFLEPFIDNPDKPMNLTFLEKYNALSTELQSLFTAVRTTKKELFAHVETVMAKIRPVN